ncbi:COG1470 family protein [Geoglobus acetivorans]|uniref:CARDB domain-containing protein n=1 Tax=Geoglobus acetivorans TaxID=565033 RepID=A0A0A7GHZ0_GEOAI|nr:hypothetical protein GACE_1509 [Geoglobus acetivorans]
MGKTYVKILFSAVLVLALVYGAEAISIGISPSFIDFKDLLRGQVVEGRARIYNTQDSPAHFKIETGEFSEWVEVLNTAGEVINEIEVPPSGYHEIIVRLKIPEDASNGNYKIPVFFVSSSEGGKVGVGMKAPLNLVFTVTGEQKKSVKLMLFTIEDTEVGIPARMEVDILNNGNVVADPTVEITVFNPDGIEVWRNQTAVKIKPQEIKAAKISWDTSKIAEGTYTGRLRLLMDGKEILTEELKFNVFEKGTLTARMEILNISVEKVIQPGKMSKVELGVKNTGQIDTEVRMRIEIYNGSEFIDLSESDPLWLEKGQTGILTAYLKISEPGNYTLKPVLSYGGRIAKLSGITVEVTSQMVRQESASNSSAGNDENSRIPGFGIYSAMLIAGTVLLLMKLRMKGKKR